MPNRIIREGIITSDRIEQLDPAGEVFYRRLLNKVDDHGLYDARPSILRSSLYPLRLDRVREADCTRWIAACEKAGLIALYEAGGKPYLKVLDTRWQVRSEPKYPPPIAINCKQVLATAPVVVDVDVGVDGDEQPSRSLKKQALEVLIFLNEKADRDYQPVEANLELISARLNEGASVEVCKAVIERKVRDWRNDEKMSQYLRPATLFNRTKFAQYQGEISRKQPQTGEVI
jgi:uncharacterized phage protein (TIGR02220 family)